MGTSVKIGNHFYDAEIEHFALHLGDSVGNVKELLGLRRFARLKSANFSLSDLNDEGLSFLSELIRLESLNLQETEITNDGIKHLRKLKNLKWLRLKGNPQLTNECISHMLEIGNLEDLEIQETSINQDGLKKLVAMKSLKSVVLDVWQNNFTFEGLLKLSVDMPSCCIVAKGDGEFCNGKFEGTWGH